MFEPRWVPGLNFTVDYYDIKVKNVIANVSAQTILNNCYDAADLNNAFCPLVNPRQADGSFDPIAAVNVTTVNFARLEAEGIDFDLQYRKTFENGDRITLRGIATHVIARNNFLDENRTDLPNRVKGELGDPDWAINFNASYRTGPITVDYSVRWLDKMTIGGYENYFPHQGLCPASGTVRGQACTPGTVDTVPAQNPDFTAERFYPSVFYHDIRLDWRVNTTFNFYVGVDNITDKLPPFGLTGAGGGSGIYNNTGRFFYAGIRAEL